MFFEKYGFRAELPIVAWSADGALKLTPGSWAAGSGRVMVSDTAARATACSLTS